MMKKVSVLFILCIICVISLEADVIAKKEVTEELLFSLEEMTIDISTLTPKKLRDVPGIVTVITAEQIKDTGARDLFDVLRRVPGMGVTLTRPTDSLVRHIESRGMQDNADVLVMVDGHRLSDFFTGGHAYLNDDSFPLDNIEKIEIIRGPGSALYGTNAFSGVINLITKKGDDIDGIETSASTGSFNTYKTNMLAGTKKGDFQISSHAFYLKTDGPKLKVETDKTSLFPLNNSSKAPGSTKDEKARLDIGLNMDYKDSFIKVRYIKTERKGVYLGVNANLTDESYLEADHFFGDVGYHFELDKLQIDWKAYSDRSSIVGKWEYYPEGWTPAPFLTFVDGMMGIARAKLDTYGTELRANYSLFEGNELIIAAFYEYNEQYDVTNHENFIYDPNGGPPLPLADGMMDNTLSNNWNKNVNRRIEGLYLEDTWDITDTVSLTMGVRYDNYSDFGETLNPRGAFIYKFLDGGSLKFLYGTAFRVPITAEMYVRGTVSPELKPENIRSFEVAANYVFSPLTAFNVNFFHNEIDNMIDLSTNAYVNTGKRVSDGFEVELMTGVNRNLTTNINYSYVYAKDLELVNELPFYSRHKANVGFNFRIFGDYVINPNVYLISAKNRENNDTRDPTPAYGLVDVNFRAIDILPQTEIALSVHNLFDQEYYDSSPLDKNVNPDYPRPGITILGTINISF